MRSHLVSQHPGAVFTGLIHPGFESIVHGLTMDDRGGFLLGRFGCVGIVHGVVEFSLDICGKAMQRPSSVCKARGPGLRALVKEGAKGLGWGISAAVYEDEPWMVASEA